MLGDRTLGFIGAGNMATALIRGILNAKLAAAGNVQISDIDSEKVASLVSAHKVKAAGSNPDLVSDCDIVVLAVKPQVIGDVLSEIASAVTSDHCIISIAAGVKTERIESALGEGSRVIRVMPNTPALIGAGAAGIAPGQWATRQDAAFARALFEAVGMAIVLDESHLDAVTAVSGSGPAYVFYFVEALTHAAQEVGLDSEVAERLAKQTVLGAARMVNEIDQTPSALREAVTSPGGTTEAALKVMREGDLSDLIVEAVRAATARSIELGK